MATSEIMVALMAKNPAAQTAVDDSSAPDPASSPGAVLGSI